MKTFLISFFFTAFTASAQTEWLVRNSGTTTEFASVAFGGGVFVAVGDGRPVRSTDGVTWSRPSWPGGTENERMLAVHYTGSRFIAFSNTGTWYSADGRTAVRVPADAVSPTGEARAATIKGITVVSSCYRWSDARRLPCRIASGSTKLEPVTDFPSTEEVAWVIAVGEEFLAGTNSAIFASTDGLAWSLRCRKFIGVAPVERSGVLFQDGISSADAGKTWTQDSEWGWQTINLYAANTFLGLDGQGLHTSPDARNWTLRESGTTDFLTAAAYGNNMYVCVGNGGRITTSTTPTAPPPAAVPTLKIGPAVVLKWPSEAGRWYQVEGSTNLGAWAAEGELIPGNGQELTRSIEQTAAKRYFRVVVK